MWMWSKRASELWDIARISEPNWDGVERPQVITPLQSTARREDCKDKDLTKVIQLLISKLIRNEGERRGGGSENKCSAMPCALCCNFSHLHYSFAYDYFTIDDVVKQMK